MLSGTPVVASDSGGHREILSHEETGLLVPPEDAAALAEAAIGLLKDEDRRARLAANAKAAAEARFSAPEHARQVGLVYDEILASA